ncbi:MAG: F0F1 ATP synthase subunit A [Oscillospiraceae bacterium]
MEELSKELVKSLDNTIAFKIPIFGGIPVPTSCVVTWIIMAILIGLALIFTHNLKIIPGKRQALIESFVVFLRNFIKSCVGEKGLRYFPWLATVLLYIGLSNIIGMLGFVPPTKDLNVTAGLAVTSIFMIEKAGIQSRGTKGWIKSFAQPMPILLPINLMEIVIKPLSLCMRLFGNVLGSFIIMKLLEALCPVVIPVLGSAYFDIFDGFIQAYIFVFLTGLFMKESMGVED